jgi:hypothetical protein
MIPHNLALVNQSPVHYSRMLLPSVKRMPRVRFWRGKQGMSALAECVSTVQRILCHGGSDYNSYKLNVLKQ